MWRKLSLLFFSLTVIINLFIPTGNQSLAANNDTVYSRNGEVYVMIGEGQKMGVYANQELQNGTRVIKKKGVKLFGDTTLDPETGQPKMSYYRSIAVDQFRNIYVLAGKLDPGLINIPDNSYFPVDPPLGEGIVGLGKKDGVEFHDIVNHYDGVYPNYHQSSPIPGRATERRPGYSGFAVVPGVSGAGNIVRPALPTGLDSQGRDILTNYQNKYPQRKGSIKRIPLNYWYQGLNDWTVLDNGTKCGYAGQVMQITWQIKFDVKVQRVNLWISHYVDGANVPPGIVPTRRPDPPITPNVVNDMMENVFNTTNMSYTRQRATSCAESDHPGFLQPSTGTVSTDYKIGFTTTGAGRRYVYSSLPSPKIKKGTIKLVAGNTYGIPQLDSDDFNGRHSSQSLEAWTVGIGAATKNANEDYVYTAPKDFGGMEVIDFAVADQWDGTGGVRYLLLQERGGNYKFNINKNKKLKWNKMNAYTAAAGNNVVDGIMDLPKDVKAIAGDGGGSVYYLTDPRAVFEASAAGDTFWGKDSNLTNYPTSLKPLDTPGRPDGPIVLNASTGQRGFRWFRKFSAPAATELYQVEYYTKTITNLNYFIVGATEGLVMEDYSDAAGTILISRGIPEQIPPGIKDIKVALATINLAGPPTGNEERMCVDVVSSNATTKKLQDVKVTDISGARLVQYDMTGDEIAEDTQYRCYMENAPLKFSDDIVRKNIISGTVLKDENGNGIKGGFDYASRPATACYYWRVEMVEPMKKPMVPDTNFATTTNPVRNVSLARVTAAPTNWPGSPGVNIADGTWYGSRGSNADRIPANENALAAEAAPDFAFTPKEPGVYKISLAASVKKWDYSVLGYPSYISDREIKAGCKDGTTHYLFFDNGSGGGVAGNGIKDGTEGYVAERYIVVTAKKTVPDKYITNISITGPDTIKENEIGVWNASFRVKFAKSFNHEDKNVRMETYNGIGVWSYPKNVTALWGLPAYDGRGDNYTLANTPAFQALPSNAALDNGVVKLLPIARNFGEVPSGARVIANLGNAKVWGFKDNIPMWVEGAGTNTSPAKELNCADRGAIEYEWCLAAEQKDGANGASKFFGAQIDGSVTDPTDPRRCPSIVIAKGRLSDEGTFPRDRTKKAVTWANYANADRTFDVNVNLRYAFDMPLDPGYYYLYIKFSYPKVKWAGRSPKKNENGKYVNAAGAIVNDEKDAAFAYYDLVPDTDTEGKTNFCTENWDATAYNANVNVPSGFKIKVTDQQPPQAYFTCEDPMLNPDPTTALSSAAPAGGVMFKGGTTGDPFPGAIAYKVCDNNPNQGISSEMMARCGPSGSAQDFTWKKYNSDIRETEDVMVGFDINKVKSVLEKTINPKAAVRPPGVIQDAVNIAVNEYPGYGNDAPYRQACYKIIDPKTAFPQDRVPYDMIGHIPLYAIGTDGTGNKMSDFNRDGNYNELIGLVGSGSDEGNHKRLYPNAPANLVIADNDAPSVRFTALRARDGVVREYVVTGVAVQNGVLAVHSSNHDNLEWDPTVPKKLRYCAAGRSPFEVRVKDLDLNGGLAQLPNQNNPVFDTAILQFDNTKSIPLDKTKRASANNEAKVENDAAGIDNFMLKFNGRSVKVNSIYNDYAPVEMVVYDFNQILNGGGKTLELIEDSRTQFTISVTDNVDGKITPSLTSANAATMGGSVFVDTQDLGEPQALVEVMNGWKVKGTLLETYGIFRDPTPANNNPFMLVVGKDNSGNSTVMRIPITIVHTYMKKDVIDVESKRTE